MFQPIIDRAIFQAWPFPTNGQVHAAGACYVDFKGDVTARSRSTPSNKEFELRLARISLNAQSKHQRNSAPDPNQCRREVKFSFVLLFCRDWNSSVTEGRHCETTAAFSSSVALNGLSHESRRDL
jgi:hypothetical protein